MIRYIGGFYKLEWDNGAKWFKCLYHAQAFAAEQNIEVSTVIDRLTF